MKKVMLLGGACLLAGCVSLKDVSNNLNAKWTGEPYDDFIIKYGAAQNVQKLQNGMIMNTYERKEGPGSVCTVNVLVDKSNNIKSIDASGNPGYCNYVMSK